jgi:hypothetical protein
MRQALARDLEGIASLERRPPQPDQDGQRRDQQDNIQRPTISGRLIVPHASKPDRLRHH